MPIALTLGETFWYQLKADRAADGKEDPAGSFFELGPLTPAQEATITDESFRFDGSGVLQGFNYGTSNYRRVAFALRGWRNFRDGAGAEVKWTGVPMTDLMRISLAHRVELAEAQREHFSITRAEGN